jgi:hypothetical protein
MSKLDKNQLKELMNTVNQIVPKAHYSADNIDDMFCDLAFVHQSVLKKTILKIPITDFGFYVKKHYYTYTYLDVLLKEFEFPIDFLLDEDFFEKINENLRAFLFYEKNSLSKVSRFVKCFSEVVVMDKFSQITLKLKSKNLLVSDIIRIEKIYESSNMVEVRNIFTQNDWEQFLIPISLNQLMEATKLRIDFNDFAESYGKVLEIVICYQKFYK